MRSAAQPDTPAAWLLVALSTGLFEALMLAHPGSPTSFAVLNALLLGAAGAVAAIAAGLRSRRADEGTRRGWSWLAAGCAAFALGQIAFAVQDGLSGPTTQPGGRLGDLITVIGIPLAATALVSFAGPSVTSRVVASLEAAIVTCALLFVGWAVLLEPVYSARASATARAATLVYLSGSLALLALVLVIAMRWHHDTAALALLGIAFGWITVANAMYAVRTLHGTYETGDWRIDVGWFTSFLLVALAAGRSPTGPVADPSGRWWLTLFIPYAGASVVMLTAVTRVVLGSGFDAFLELSGVALGVLVLARQLITLRQHHALATRLEQRVAQRTAELELYDRQLRALLRDSSDTLAVVGSDERFVYVSGASWSLLGLPGDALVGTPVLDRVHPEDRARAAALLQPRTAGDPATRTATFRLAHRDGRWCDVEASVSALTDTRLGAGSVLNLRDVSVRAAEHARLRHQASVDPLTSLVNRRVFDDRVSHALDRAQRSGAGVAVLFVDLDHFKEVNDTVGHEAGDQVLVDVANRLRACLRPSDTPARLGGDEFAVLLEDATPAQAEEVAARVVAALLPPYEVEDRVLVVTASVGVTTTRTASEQARDLLHKADVAMYRAKEAGRGRMEVFEAGRDARPEVEDDLAGA